MQAGAVNARRANSGLMQCSKTLFDHFASVRELRLRYLEREKQH
jgi:hypothetical protein